MSFVPVQNPSDPIAKIKTFPITEGADDLEIQAVVTVDTDGAPIEVATDATVSGIGSSIVAALEDLLTELALKADLTETQPISAAALPLPAGAATAALQTQPGVDIGDVTVNNGAGAAAVNIQDGGNSITVDGPLTDTQLRASAVPISAAALPLPAGAATSAKQDDQTTILGTLATEATLLALYNDLGAGSLHINVDNFPATVVAYVDDAGLSISVDDNGGSITVDGPLTDAELRASPVPVSGPLTDTQLRAAAVPISNTNLDATLSTRATEATLALIKAKTDNLDTALSGIKTGTDKIPATPSQEHATAASPHSARLSDGSAFYDAAKTGQLPSALVGGRLDTVVGAALPAGTNNIGDVDVLTVPADPFGANADAASATGSISAKLRSIAAVQLPAALVGGRLDTNNGAWLGSTAPTVGQKVMASSLPMVIASDQMVTGALPVRQATGFGNPVTLDTLNEEAQFDLVNGSAVGLGYNFVAIRLSVSSFVGTLEFRGVDSASVACQLVVYPSGFQDGSNPIPYGTLGSPITSIIPPPGSTHYVARIPPHINSVRVRCTAYTSGSCTAQIWGVQDSNFNPAVGEPIFVGRACTFRTPGRAGTAGQKILALHNATGSTVKVSVRKVFVDLYQTVVKAVTTAPPIVRLWKVTAVPTNGTALAKTKIGGHGSSNASVTVFGDASADGSGSGTTLTATLPAGTFITQECAPRMITAAGYEVADRIEWLGDAEVTLGPLEGVVVFLDYVAAGSNPTTDMWLAGIEWAELQ